MQYYNICCLNKDTSNQNDHSNSYQYTYLSNTIDNKSSIDQIRVISSYTLENSEGAVKYGQSRETGNIWYNRRRNSKQKHNTTQYVLDTTRRKETQVTD
jgi:hypothetical protein